jgi:hypothetical protein
MFPPPAYGRTDPRSRVPPPTAAPQRARPRTFAQPPAANTPPNLGTPNRATKPPLPSTPPIKTPAGNGPQLGLPSEEPFSTAGAAPTDLAPEDAVELTIDAPDRRPVGSGAPLQLTLRNRGEQPLRNVSVVCDFDEALTFPGSELHSVTHKIPRIDSGDVRESLLTLIGESAGLHQCRFSVKIGSQTVAEKSVSVEFVSRQLDWRVDGPDERTIGSRAEFNIPLINISRGELRGLKIRVGLDGALAVREMTKGGQLAERSVSWDIDRLAADEGMLLQIEVECLALTQQACLQVSVIGDELPEDSQEVCLKVTPRMGGLEVRVQDVVDPIGEGGTAELVVAIKNDSVQTIRDVAATCAWPEGFDLIGVTQIEDGQSRPAQADVGAQSARLGELVDLEPDRSIEYRVQLRANRTGTQQLTVTVTNASDETTTKVVEPILVHR